VAVASVDRVLVVRTGRKLHIPDGDGPLCATDGAMRRKPLAVFPEPHRERCARRLDGWRRGPASA
jgi:hypothetical protein